MRSRRVSCERASTRVSRRPGYPRARPGGEPSRHLAQRLEHDRIDRVGPVDALFEILDAGPGTERRVAKLREPIVDLGPQVAFEWQPVLTRGRAEEAEMHRVDPAQLFDRLQMVVDAEIDHDVGELR